MLIMSDVCRTSRVMLQASVVLQSHFTLGKIFDADMSIRGRGVVANKCSQAPAASGDFTQSPFTLRWLRSYTKEALWVL